MPSLTVVPTYLSNDPRDRLDRLQRPSSSTFPSKCMKADVEGRNTESIAVHWKGFQITPPLAKRMLRGCVVLQGPEGDGRGAAGQKSFRFTDALKDTDLVVTMDLNQQN